MFPIKADRSPDTKPREPVPNRGCCCLTITPRVVTAVANFFKTIGLGLVEAVPAQEDTEVMKDVERLITPETTRATKISIIRAITRVPVDKRAAIIASTLHITQGMNMYGKEETVKVVLAIPAQEMAEVLRNALLLITPEMTHATKISIIPAITRIPVNERDAIIASTLHITQGMNGYEREEAIQELIAIPAQEMAEVLRNAVLWTTPEMDNAAKVRVIKVTARIPVNERDAIIALALQAITQEMDQYTRAFIIMTVIEVPAQERADVMQHALQLINPQMSVFDRVMIIRNVEGVAADQRANYVLLRRLGQQAAHLFQNAPVAAAQGINVHEGDRDQRVRAAIELLQQHQGQIPKASLDLAVQEFTQYLNDHPTINAEHKLLATYALLAPKADESFGPLISENNFSILGLTISGQELIGRLWFFASKLAEPEQTNAKDSMISALKDSYSLGSRVCNQGKTQRLVVGVLQGRFAGVDVELVADMQLTKEQAVEMFFNVKAHSEIEQLEPLIEAAKKFCNENPAIKDRAAFIREIEEYAKVTFD